MNENRIVPKLRFPEFEDEGEWEEKKIGELGEIITGSTPLTSNRDFYDGGSYMFVSPFDINKNRYIDKTNNTLTKLGFLKGRLVRRNSTLFVCIGSTIGKVGQAKNDCVTNQQINAIVPYNEYDDDFLFSLLEYHSSPISVLAGIQAVPIINKTTFSNYLLTVPSLHEQVKIGNCFSSLDEVIAQHEEKLSSLEEHKKGLMQNLFPQEGETKPKYRFPEFENEEEWEEKKLGKMSKFRRGSFPQPYGLAEWYDENGEPFVQVFDVDENLRLKQQTQRRISKLASEQSVFIPKGTVIITIQGSIGRVAITQYDAYVDRTLLLFEKFYTPIVKVFFAYVLQILFGIEKQKAPGAVIKTITKEVLSDFIIKLPSIREQQKIADCLSSIDSLISETTERIEELKQHKQGLMQSLFPKIKE